MRSTKPNGTPIHPEIEYGTEICKRLHQIFYPNTPWRKHISNNVARLYSDLKHEAKILFLNTPDVEMLRKISRYSLEDLKEMCEACKVAPKALRETLEVVSDKSAA